jgi:hypothetical protein
LSGFEEEISSVYSRNSTSIFSKEEKLIIKYLEATKKNCWSGRNQSGDKRAKKWGWYKEMKILNFPIAMPRQGRSLTPYRMCKMKMVRGFQSF